MGVIPDLLDVVVYGFQGDGKGMMVAGLAAVPGLGQGARGAQYGIKAARGAKRVANQVPETLARVVPGKGPYPTLGRPGTNDVFVTAAEDIAGLNASQISKRLTIPETDTFTVIKFNTPKRGLVSPVNRSDPGFIGGGRTAGGAREFVIPNQPVPFDGVVEIVR